MGKWKECRRREISSADDASESITRRAIEALGVAVTAIKTTKTTTKTTTTQKITHTNDNGDKDDDKEDNDGDDDDDVDDDDDDERQRRRRPANEPSPVDWSPAPVIVHEKCMVFVL